MSVPIHMFMKQLRIGLSLCCLTASVFAQGMGGIGQTLQIYTRLDSYIGKPSWIIMIRDVDHNQNIPYVFDFNQENNFWLVMTYSRNYLITASTLQFSPYRSYPGNTRSIHNFCQLESNGVIQRGESKYITVTGDLRPNADRYNCSVSSFSDNHFTVTQD